MIDVEQGPLRPFEQDAPALAALLVDVVSHMGEQDLEERFVRYAL